MLEVGVGESILTPDLTAADNSATTADNYYTGFGPILQVLCSLLMHYFHESNDVILASEIASSKIRVYYDYSNYFLYFSIKLSEIILNRGSSE